MDNLTRDVRFALRLLSKSKGFAAAAIVTLALCIGANTAIFSMLYALILKPLPYREPGRIVEITNSFPKQSPDTYGSSVAQFLDLKEHAGAFAHLALWRVTEFTLGLGSEAVRSTGVLTTEEMFDVLGLKPVLGRFFTGKSRPSDHMRYDCVGGCLDDSNRVVVLTQSFWESHFQRDPGTLGRTLQIDGASYEIIGVAPHSFEALDARVRFVLPLAWMPANERPRARYSLSLDLCGRLSPEATIGTAYTQVAALEQRFHDSAPPELREFLDRTGHNTSIDPVHTHQARLVKPKLYMLQGGVLFVLLIGCVNVANLLLARSNARQGELAIRIALGAGHRAIARQLLVESIVLVWLGAAFGLAFAWSALRIINRFTAQLLPNALPMAIDGPVLGYTALIAALTPFAIGLFSIVHVLGSNLLGLMQNQSRSASGGRSVRTMSGVLVVVQTALALILLIGAGLLIRSFANVLSVDPGFNPRQLIAARIALTADWGRSGDGRDQQFQQLLVDALHEIPGLKSVSLATATPIQDGLPHFTIRLRDYTLPENAPQMGAFFIGATPSYLETMQIPLLEGRWFNAGDTMAAHWVCVVNQDFARRNFAGRSAVGQQFTLTGGPPKPKDWREIVGVVGNVRHLGVEENSGADFFYNPLLQNPFYPSELSVLIRSSRSPQEVIALVRESVKKIDPALPVFEAGPMESFISTSFDERRSILLLLGSFAGIALLLSAVGIYGVLAYDVSRRTHEIGIRAAIGATRKQVRMLILRQGLAKAGIGLVIGIAGAFEIGRFMTSLLFEVKPMDPAAYIGATLLLLAVALLACYIPAHRAARMDPVTSLRYE